jgi:signal transduction histidine kinase/CheY-like chemotaxis protein
VERLCYQDWARRNRLAWFGQAAMLALLFLITPLGPDHPQLAVLLTVASASLGLWRLNVARLLLRDQIISWQRCHVILAACSAGQAALWGVTVCLAMSADPASGSLAVALVLTVANLQGVAFTHTPMPDEFDRSLFFGLAPPILASPMLGAGFAVAVSLVAIAMLGRGLTRRQHRLWLVQMDQRTRERQRTEELEHAQQEAQLAEAARSRFLANISHELRTPLNGIIGLTDLCLDESLSAEARDNLVMVRDSGQHMRSLVDDLLDYSKIEHGKFELASAPLRFRETINEAAGQLRALARQRQLEFAVQIDDALPDQLIGDAKRLRQIILNLGSNAIKFTDAGRVLIRCRMQRRLGERVMLHVEVEDTGIGIAEDQCRVIFEAFHQADGGHARRHGGTGLGLAISSHLVKRMGGEIWVESWPGRGSTFHFTAVMWPSLEGESSARAPLADTTPPPSRRVLVAEDNPINQQLMLKLLQRLGQQVELARNGREAVEACRRARPDLVLMDLQMPEMDGLEATRMIRAEESDTPVIIVALTANAMVSDRAACLAAGMDDFLAKPIKAEQLVSLLHDLPVPAAV